MTKIIEKGSPTPMENHPEGLIPITISCDGCDIETGEWFLNPRTDKIGPPLPYGVMDIYTEEQLVKMEYYGPSCQAILDQCRLDDKQAATQKEEAKQAHLINSYRALLSGDEVGLKIFKDLVEQVVGLSKDGHQHPYDHQHPGDRGGEKSGWGKGRKS